ncbi:MAG: hypothetical protein MK078_05595 [Crocinitomicaceae bacterium]|nr:hypothetical protein [Crocinitomicaceae bacterium]
MKRFLTSAFALLAFTFGSSAQIHCGTVELVPNTTTNALATFNNFSYYEAGYTINSVARVRVRVTDQAIPDPLCSWSLIMSVENNPIAGTPANEWEELATYGSGSAANPTIDMLQIRVRNACATSPINGVFQNFTNHGDVIDIISPLLPVTPAGSCVTNVNGPGDYISNYDEYNFDIDVRINPGFAVNPGIFQLNIKFRLEENP